MIHIIFVQTLKIFTGLSRLHQPRIDCDEASWPKPRPPEFSALYELEKHRQKSTQNIMKLLDLMIEAFILTSGIASF